MPNHPRFTERANEVAELLMGSGKPLYCIGKNRDGSPKHPARGTHVLQTWPLNGPDWRLRYEIRTPDFPDRVDQAPASGDEATDDF